MSSDEIIDVTGDDSVCEEVVKKGKGIEGKCDLLVNINLEIRK